MRHDRIHNHTEAERKSVTKSRRSLTFTAVAVGTLVILVAAGGYLLYYSTSAPIQESLQGTMMAGDLVEGTFIPPTDETAGASQYKDYELLIGYPGRYQIDLRSEGPEGADPDFSVLHEGRVLSRADEYEDSLVTDLGPGTYVLRVHCCEQQSYDQPVEFDLHVRQRPTS